MAFVEQAGIRAFSAFARAAGVSSVAQLKAPHCGCTMTWKRLRSLAFLHMAMHDSDSAHPLGGICIKPYGTCMDSPTLAVSPTEDEAWCF